MPTTRGNFGIRQPWGMFCSYWRLEAAQYLKIKCPRTMYHSRPPSCIPSRSITSLCLSIHCRTIKGLGEKSFIQFIPIRIAGLRGRGGNSGRGSSHSRCAIAVFQGWVAIGWVEWEGEWMPLCHSLRGMERKWEEEHVVLHTTLDGEVFGWGDMH